VPPRLVQARIGRVARAMTHLEGPSLVATLVGAFPSTQAPYMAALRQRLGKDGSGCLAAMAFWVTQQAGLQGKLQIKLQKQIASTLNDWIRSAPQSEFDVAADRLKRWVSSGDAKAWRELVGSMRGRGLFAWRRSGKKG
jgi:GTPase-associated protein 1, C-terminal domain